jgi:hypothetical protein
VEDIDNMFDNIEYDPNIKISTGIEDIDTNMSVEDIVLLTPSDSSFDTVFLDKLMNASEIHKNRIINLHDSLGGLDNNTEPITGVEAIAKDIDNDIIIKLFKEKEMETEPVKQRANPYLDRAKELKKIKRKNKKYKK